MEDIKIEEVMEKILKIFSENGFCTDFFCIKIEEKTNISFSKDGDRYTISFSDNKPRVMLSKYIKYYLNLNYITLGKSGGYISVGVLPRIPFKYSWLS
jgi:hypothetical protein